MIKGDATIINSYDNTRLRRLATVGVEYVAIRTTPGTGTATTVI